MTISKIIMVMAGGALGAFARYAISAGAGAAFGTAFPWGTLIVNLAGCFAIGLVATLADVRHLISPEMRLFIITGFLGALTTFSSFGLETINLGSGGAALSAATNVLLNNVAGIALVIAGIWAGRAVG